MGMTEMFFKKIFCIDCTNAEDVELQDLRRVIVELSEYDDDFWGQLMPSRYLLLEDKMTKAKSDGNRVMTLSEIESLNQMSELPIESKEELFVFLKMHHGIGTLMHFADEGLQNMIILDVQWLIDSLTLIITADCFRDPKYTKEWEMLTKKGIVYKEFMEEVWKGNTKERFYEFKDQLILLMIKTDLIASPRQYDEKRQHTKSPYFVIPCMLQRAPSDLQIYTDEQTYTCPTLLFQFENEFLPTATVYRLLAICIMEYGGFESSTTTVFSDSAVFTVFVDHMLFLEFTDVSIKAIVYNTYGESPKVEICQGIREFLEDTLTHIITAQRTTTKFDTKVAWNHECNGLCQLKWCDLVGKLEIQCADITHIPRHVVRTEEVLRYWQVTRVST